MSLAGFGKSIVEGIVALRYEANVDDAKAKIKDLSGAQKKAAKETAEAYKEQNDAFKKHVVEFGKGAAIIGTGIAVAANGLAAYREESKLMAATTGVDIDRLSDSWDGLKTRMELMTLAQAGHQGAWKLTTGQLHLVSEGMRALEKKGYDTEKVFDRFTEVMKKGKLEGLDEFGLSVKSTGDQTKDLQILMQALGREVTDVGGNFDQTGDGVVRSMTRARDAVNNLQYAVGAVTDYALRAAGAFGNWAGKLAFGDLPDITGTAGRSEKYAQGFKGLAGPRANENRSFETGFGMFVSKPSDADEFAGRTLSNFAASVRRSMDGKGPLATKTPEEFAEMIAGLPKDWDLVDKNLAVSVELLKGRLQERFATVGAEAGESVLIGFKNALGKNRDSVAKSGGRGGAKSSAAVDDWWLEGLINTGGEFAGFLGATAGANIDAAAMRRQQEEIETQRWEAALEVNRRFGVEMAALESERLGAERESFLERSFGKIEEFDEYAEAFSTLSAVGTAAWGALYDVIVSGEGNLGTAVRKAIASALGAEAQQFGARGFMTFLQGAAYTAMGDPRGPGTMAAGGAMMAGAVTVGALAAALGGGSTNTMRAGSSSAAGVGRSGGPAHQDHRKIVMVGDPLSDDSPRERQRRVRKVLRAAGEGPAGVTHG